MNNNVTLDLNGYTIKSTGGSSNSHFVLICDGSRGNLTICDGSEQHTGKIICDAKTTAGGKLISTVYNNGSLTVTGGTISNTVSAVNNTCYAIESVTVNNTSVSISGDAVISSTGEALRVYSQGSGGTHTASISGGTYKTINVYTAEGLMWAAAQSNLTAPAPTGMPKHRIGPSPPVYPTVPTPTAPSPVKSWSPCFGALWVLL